MANITTTVSDIQELDQTNQALGQELIKATQAECEIYKRAFEKLTSELAARDTKILALKERLPTAASQAPLMSSSAKSHQDSGNASNVVGLMERTVSKLADYDQINMNLLQQALHSCEQERDVYKNGIERLASAIIQRDQEIGTLELQATALESSPASANKYLKDHIAQVNVSYIDDNEVTPVLQDLTYLIYQQANPFKDINGINPRDPGLVKAAEEALKKIGAPIHLSPQTIITSLLKSYDRNVGSKGNVFKTSPSKFPDPREVARKVTSARGLAQELFARFYVRKAAYDKERKRLEEHPAKAGASSESKYSDFPFSNMPLLAGQLSLLERIFTDLRSQLPDNDQAKELEAKLKDIKEIRAIFFDLLNKCRLKKA